MKAIENRIAQYDTLTKSASQYLSDALSGSPPILDFMSRPKATGLYIHWK